jgi:hypothetical protein
MASEISPGFLPNPSLLDLWFHRQTEKLYPLGHVCGGRELLGIPAERFLYPVYVRAESYLRMSRGDEAAIEFQKMPEHPGILQNCILAALSKLGMVALFVCREPVSSRAHTTAILPGLWGNADREIPILQQAIREYGKLEKLTSK